MGDYDGVGQVAGALVTVALVDRVLIGLGLKMPKVQLYSIKRSIKVLNG